MNVTRTIVVALVLGSRWWSECCTRGDSVSDPSSAKSCGELVSRSAKVVRDIVKDLGTKTRRTSKRAIPENPFRGLDGAVQELPEAWRRSCSAIRANCAVSVRVVRRARMHKVRWLGNSSRSSCRIAGEPDPSGLQSEKPGELIDELPTDDLPNGVGPSLGRPRVAQAAITGNGRCGEDRQAPSAAAVSPPA